MNRNAPPQKLTGLPALLWRELDAAEDGWRVPVLATRNGNEADARIVVLREAQFVDRRLTFFTDRRSDKFGQLKTAPRACLVFYDRECSLQLRCYGTAIECTDTARLDAGWSSLRDEQRRMYASAAPGAALDARADATHFRKKGRENFAAFDVIVDAFRCLWLTSDGNVAAHFAWNGSDWSGRWEAP